MTSVEAAALAAVMLGIAGCVVLFFSRPQYWVETGLFLLKKFGPAVIKAAFAYMTGRMTKEQEEAKNYCLATGGKWDNWRKKCRY